MHDQTDLEARGVPAVFVATVEFIDGAETVGVYTPHPIQDRTDEEMREIADKVFEGVVAQIVVEG